jgi:hypothetical protein
MEVEDAYTVYTFRLQHSIGLYRWPYMAGIYTCRGVLQCNIYSGRVLWNVAGDFRTETPLRIPKNYFFLFFIFRLLCGLPVTNLLRPKHQLIIPNACESKVKKLFMNIVVFYQHPKSIPRKSAIQLTESITGRLPDKSGTP